MRLYRIYRTNWRPYRTLLAALLLAAAPAWAAERTVLAEHFTNTG